MNTSHGQRTARVAVAALAVLVSSPLHAGAALHAGPLRTIGAIDSVACQVTNVQPASLDEVRIVIRSTNFGTVVSDVTCYDVAQWSECLATLPTTGVTTAVRLACSAQATGKKDALRGTFQRWSPTGQSGDLVIELR